MLPALDAIPASSSQKTLEMTARHDPIASSPDAQRLRRTALSLALAGVLTGGLATAAHAAISFDVQALGLLPGGSTMTGAALSDSGQVSGYTDMLNGGIVATRWVNGVATAMQQLPGTMQSMAGGINASGVMAGTSYANGVGRAVIWRSNNLISVLPSFGNDSSNSAFAVNDAGVVVGASSAANQPLHAVMWINGQVVDIGAHALLKGKGSSAKAINNLGQLLLSSAGGDYVWHNGSLSLLNAPTGGSNVSLDSINDQGWVTGKFSNAQGNVHAALWRNGSAIDLGDLSGGAGSSAGVQVNASGQVVGGSTGGNGGNGTAFIWGGGQMVKLDSLLTNSAWTLLGARAINASGQIVALGQKAGAYGDVLLTPKGSLKWAATGGGSFADPTKWDSGIGFAPSRLLDAQLISAATQKVMGPASDQDVRSLIVGGGTGTMTLALQSGAVLNSLNGTQIEATGVLTGDGTLKGGLGNAGTVRADNLSIVGSFYNTGLVKGDGRIAVGVLTNLGGGRVQSAAGSTLRIAGGLANTAGGSVELIGGATGQARLEVSGLLDNQSGASMKLRDASVQAGQLGNAGQIGISFGTTDMFGKLINAAGASVIGSGASNVTFWDAVTNQGEFRASAGSRMVYFGLVNGAGSFTTNGGGSHRFEGGYAPGNSPAVVTVGDVEFASELAMELAGTTPGNGGAHHDKIIFTGTVLFDAGATLKVLTLDGFMPQSGQHFDLFDFTLAPQGQFSAIALPDLAQGLSWDVSQLYTAGEISVAGVPSAVPEPSTWAVLLAGLSVLAWRRRAREV